VLTSGTLGVIGRPLHGDGPAERRHGATVRFVKVLRVLLVIVVVAGLAAGGFAVGRSTKDDDKKSSSPVPEICQRTTSVAQRLGTEAIDGLTAARDKAGDATAVNRHLALARVLKTHLDALTKECEQAYSTTTTTTK
jgi:hypothetical protein